MPARITTHPDPLVAQAIRQARHRVANPEEVAHLPAWERTRLFSMAWAVLKTAQGRPVKQTKVIIGGDAA